MGAANLCQIVLGSAAIEYTREPVADNATELFPKDAISGVFPVKINSKPAAPDDAYWNYRFDDMIIVTVNMHDGSHFNFDLQEVTNQAGWTADLAGQQQCIDDINTWLAT